MSISDLAAAIGNVPHNSKPVHMMVLARAGLLKGVKAGRETIYRANHAAVAELGSFISELAGSRTQSDRRSIPTK